MIQKSYKISGMDCASCASLIELDLEDAGVKATCSYHKETLSVEFDEGKISEDKIHEVVKTGGYSLQST